MSHRRLDYAVLVIGLIFPSLVTWLYFVTLADRPASVQQTAAGIGKLLQFTLPVVWVFGVLRARAKLAMPRANDVIVGLGSGAVIAGAMLGLYFGALKTAGAFAPAIAQVQDKVSGIGIDSAWKFAALGLFYALIHSLLEEYYWRWFVFGQLRRIASFWPAAIVSSLGFMAHHVILLGVYFGFDTLLTYFFAFCVAIGGMIWAWLYERSGRLYGPWISHLLVDAGIFFIGWDIVRATLAMSS